MPSKRRFRRWETDLPAFVQIDGTPYPCRISGVSPGGARIRLLHPRAIAVGSTVALDLDGYEPIAATVRHAVAEVVGLEFPLEEEEQRLLARWLLALRPPRRPERRQCRIKAAFRIAGVEFACVVTELARTGAAITTDHAAALAVASELTLLLPGQEPLAAIIRHVDGGVVGLMFVDPYRGELPA